MSNKILVTDSLFIFDEHVKQLEKAGFEIERLDTPTATEEQLIKGLKDKVGYILGGIEKVTDKVISSTDQLKVIGFTGSDWKALITGWEKATEKGIAITNAPGGNSYAVAEYAVTLALAMQRNIFELGRTGEKTFETSPSFKDSVIGVIGAGHIGSKIIGESQSFFPKKVVYYSRSAKDCDAELVSLDELMAESDIVFVAVPGTAGELLNAEQIKRMKKNSLLVSISPKNLIDL